MNPLDQQATKLRMTRLAVVLSLTASMSLAVLLAAGRTYWIWVVVGLSATGVIAWRIAGLLATRQRSLGWLLALAALNMVLGVPELALRLVDFRYESGIQFGFPRPSHFVYYQPDEQLFWRLRASNPRANSLGFEDRELTVPKPPGTYRILFLGDSVTHQGYPRHVEQLLNHGPRHRLARFESVTMALAGYSSHQGRVIAELYGHLVDPDLVVVYFGWNDHWRAYGEIDAEKRIEVSKSAFGTLWDQAYASCRLLQSLTWLSAQLLRGHAERLDEVRVPSDLYRSNLTRIRELFAERDVPVLFVTAATSLYRLGIHPELVESGQILDEQTGIRMHREYNEIVRTVALEPGALLLDLERQLEDRSEEELRAIFLEDRIHLTEVGLSVVADRIADVVERELLAQQQSDALTYR